MTEYIARSIDQNFTNADGDVVAPESPDDYGYITEYGFDHLYNNAELIPEESSDVETQEVEILAGIPEQKKERSERMAEIHERFGFMPTSYDELTHATLLKMVPRTTGSATYLNSVMQRQQRILASNIQTATDNHQPGLTDEQMDMPRRTIFSIVNRFKDYAANAGREAYFLGEAQKTITQQSKGVHNFASANTLPIIADWEKTQQVGVEGLRALIEIARMADAVALKDGRSDTLPAPNSYFAYETNADARARIEGVVDSLKVYTLKSSVIERINQQHQRRTFWIDQLQEARAHSTNAHPMHIAATAALLELKVLTQEGLR